MTGRKILETSVAAGLLMASRTSAITFATLASFTGSNGAFPSGKLALDSAGNLYGTTGGNQANTGYGPYGTVFEISRGTHALSSLYTCSASTNDNPTGGLFADPFGNLYGVFANGANGRSPVVFELAGGTHGLTNRATVAGGPVSDFTFDNTGNVYGTTTMAGTSSVGSLYELPTSASSITTLASFNRSNGMYPQDAGLYTDVSGNIWGTAFEGGDYSQGTLYEFSAQSQTLNEAAAFGTPAGGQHPISSVVADSAGNLYGTTSAGGISNVGTVWEFDRSSGTLNTLAAFNGSNGSDPDAGVLIDAAGDLFGTTSTGGAYNDGTVFELQAGSGIPLLLHSFNGSDGSVVHGGLAVDAAGDLYGTTLTSGPGGDGTVYELTNAGYVSAVPEPSSIPVAVAAGVVALARIKRRARSASVIPDERSVRHL